MIRIDPVGFSRRCTRIIVSTSKRIKNCLCDRAHFRLQEGHKRTFRVIRLQASQPVSEMYAVAQSTRRLPGRMFILRLSYVVVDSRILGPGFTLDSKLGFLDSYL